MPDITHDIITSATSARLLKSVRACIGDAVIVSYKNASTVGTLLQIEGTLTDTGNGSLTICVSDDSTGKVTATAQLTEHSITGFARPTSYRSLPVIFVR